MRPVLPHELPQVWAFVESGLQEILSLTHEEWTPTHVRQCVNKGFAFLFVSDDGFVVLQRREADWSGTPYLNVWAMWFRPKTAHKRLREFVAWLDDLAQKTGSVHWEFGSPRHGWEWLEKLGICERVTTIWRRKK